MPTLFEAIVLFVIVAVTPLKNMPSPPKAIKFFSMVAVVVEPVTVIDEAMLSEMVTLA